MQVHDLAVQWDGVRNEWRCDLPGIGHPTIVTKSLAEMEVFLDWYDIYRCKEKHDADFDTERE
jgi:hypothetical protein